MLKCVTAYLYAVIEHLYMASLSIEAAPELLVRRVLRLAPSELPSPKQDGAPEQS